MNQPTKTAMYFVLLILLTSTINATTIDLSEETQPNQDLIKKINQYDIVSEIAKEYDAIGVKIDDYKVVLVFDNQTLKQIKENSNQITDFNINITIWDALNLYINRNKMDSFDKLKYISQHSDMSEEDILTLSGIAMGVRI